MKEWFGLGTHSTAHGRVDGMMMIINSRDNMREPDNPKRSLVIKINQEIAKKIDVKWSPVDLTQKGKRDRIAIGYDHESELFMVKKVTAARDGFLVGELDTSENLTTVSRNAPPELVKRIGMSGNVRVKAYFKLAKFDVVNGVLYFERSGK